MRKALSLTYIQNQDLHSEFKFQVILKDFSSGCQSRSVAGYLRQNFFDVNFDNLDFGLTELRRISLLSVNVEDSPILRRWKTLLGTIINSDSDDGKYYIFQCSHKGMEKLYMGLTKLNEFRNVFKSDDWYTKYGGIFQADASHLSEIEMDILEENPLALLDVGSVHIKQAFCGSSTLIQCTSKCNVATLENSLGFNVQSVSGHLRRMTKGSKWPLSISVSRFGKPSSQNTVVSLDFLDTFDVGEDCLPAIV